MSTSINVVIVEAHHHSLEHIHATIRKEKIFRPWSMLHFDAHPDLACPRIPAVACFTPRRVPMVYDSDVDRATSQEFDSRDLYELLDSTSSGIAEWILPLVLAAKLTTIEWVKPAFSNQIGCGVHRYQVGAHDPSSNSSIKKEVSDFWDLSPKALLKVDWNHTYYWDDNSVVPSEELALAETLHLHVVEIKTLRAQPPNHGIHWQMKGSRFLEKEGQSEPWVLDICLDYFVCLNPYLSEIDAIDPQITIALLNLMRECNLVGTASNTKQTVDSTYLDNLQEFQHLIKAILSSAKEEKQSFFIEKLSRFYESNTKSIALVEALKEQLQKYPSSTDAVIDAVPYWNMPHEPASMKPENIEASLHLVEKALTACQERATEASNKKPFLISIARSADDGFMPLPVVESIQKQVLAILDRVFCHNDNSDCTMRIIRDYGEWEGSTID